MSNFVENPSPYEWPLAKAANGTTDGLIRLDRWISTGPEEVIVGEVPIGAREVVAVARQDVRVRLTDNPAVLQRLAQCHERMMHDVGEGVPVYGCNTGYGAQAEKVIIPNLSSYRLQVGRSISEAIAAIDVSVGPPLPRDVIRAGILLRVNMLMSGVSAIKRGDLDLLCSLLNLDLTPYVQQFGGLGASGDLAHNSRIVSVLRQVPGAKVWNRAGVLCEARAALAEAGLEPLQLDPKAGLGLCNGDNFSTALGLLIGCDTLELLLAMIASSALVIEVLRGSDRDFHPLLDMVRPHDGQREAAALFRYLLKGSGLAAQEMTGQKAREEGNSVQDAYSVRGLSQFLAVGIERLKSAFKTLTINANSVSDNPVWVPPEAATPGEAPWQWVSGGNFLAMHAAEHLDELRKTITQVVKLCARHLARIVNYRKSNGLPPNLSDRAAVTGCSFKGVEIQAGMFDVYSMLLAFPVTTMFGDHEESNQDISTHAITSGILAMENLKIARYSMAQNLVALAQAVDLRGGPAKLSARTRPLYEFVRNRCGYVTKERPLHDDIEAIYDAQVTNDLAHLLRSQVFVDFDVEAAP